MKETAKQIIKKVPVPTAGVALGLAALGVLLQPYSEILHVICGVLSALFVVMLLLKISIFPQMVRDDMQNPMVAAVSGTLYMTLMQLSTYLVPFAKPAAFALWVIAVLAHLCLIIWFTATHIRRFSLEKVFPTYFICYVGIISASATAPSYGMQPVGQVLFWFGFLCYAVLFVVVSLRYLHHEMPEIGKPLFCIYAAPMSLSIVGYIACFEHPHVTIVGTLLLLAQVLLVIVVTQLPRLVRMKFYPSFAAMTFPFVISATALIKAIPFLRANGLAAPSWFEALALIETLLACGMVIFVAVHYIRFFVRSIEKPMAPDVVAEELQAAKLGESLSDPR